MDFEEIIIEGIIEDIVYSNPENGYSVIDINHNNRLITAVGIMPSCCPGEKIKLKGSPFQKFPNISPMDIESIIVPIFSSAIRKNITDILLGINRSILIQEELLCKSLEMKAGLLQQLFI